MAFLPKKWLAALWGVSQPEVELTPELDCQPCHVARIAGKDACPQHHAQHLRPHVYHMGHEIDWGSGLDRGTSAVPRTTHESIERR